MKNKVMSRYLYSFVHFAFIFNFNFNFIFFNLCKIKYHLVYIPTL